MDREGWNKERMRKCREWISLHFLILSPFPHSLSISSQPGCQAATICATLLITQSHFMPKRYIFTISYFQVNGRCWACPEKGVRSSTPPGLSLMLTSPSQSRSGELFFSISIFDSCFMEFILSFFFSKVKSKYNSITGYIQTGGGRCTTSST